ncbi:MAG TPA: type VI secretion system baseplate subunit TssK [Pseudomonadota bacterium]|jgi:type VI secretion system protein ImpJ|nr:type VI secretion system baseplate subunit TssK [Pseudomonadota bacterium]HNN52374.1 type VI secretion system baseplate subunit TssK [Pseudomonadota bacterium]
MSLFDKVAWKDGMFLLPQHFQQEARHQDATLRQLQLGTQPLGFGVVDLVIDEQALSEGRVELQSCRAIWPDGTPYQAPLCDPTPPTLPIPHAATARLFEVYLTLPARRPSVALMGEDRERRDCRFVIREQEIADDGDPDQVQSIEVASKNVRLAILQPGESDHRDGLICLKIAELEKTSTGTFAIRRDYVPPCPVLTAAPQLLRKVTELVTRMTARAESLSLQRKSRGDALEFQAADLLNFWLLHTLNSHIPKLRHLLTVPSVHPERLYAELLGLFGSLLVFEPSASREGPSYHHEAIGDCFSALLQRIYELLGVIVRERYTLIPLKQNRNAWDGRVDDQKLLEAAHLYLVATGDLPRTEFERLPVACKLADSSRVESLARTANPGLLLVPVARPPSPVPVRKDAVYFAIKAEGPLWQEIRKTGQIGVFVPRAPDGLHLELVALHEGTGAAA